MKDLKRPLVAIAASGVLALAGGGTAWACGGSGNDPGTYPGSTDTSSTDTSSTDGTSTASAASSRAARRARLAHRRHHR